MGVVPTDFNVLVKKIVTNPKLKIAIVELLSLKKSGAELDSGPRIPAIHSFVEHELLRLESKRPTVTQSPLPLQKLDRLFYSAVTSQAS